MNKGDKMNLKNINRREFFRHSALGLSAAGTIFSASGVAQDESTIQKEPVIRTLGKTNLKLPVVSMGVMNADNPHLVKKAIEVGVRHLDTAHNYQRGNNEKMIGRVLKETGLRKQIIVSTKMRFARDREKHVFLADGGTREMGATAENLTRQLGISLERLQTDYIDILYLHSCYSPKMVLYQPLMQALVRVKEAGMVRFVGVSTHQDEANVIRAAVDAGVYDVVLTAYNYFQDHKEDVRKAVHYAGSRNVGIIVMKTMGGNRMNNGSVEVNHRAALKWALQDENICTAIPGLTTFDQLETDWAVAGDLILHDEELRDLHLSSLLPNTLFCQNCRQCVSTCVQRIEIPVMMRAYMYLKGYDNPGQARETLAELNVHEGPDSCHDCKSCTATCVRNIQIRKRIRTLQSILT